MAASYLLNPYSVGTVRRPGSTILMVSRLLPKVGTWVDMDGQKFLRKAALRAAASEGSVGRNPHSKALTLGTADAA